MKFLMKIYTAILLLAVTVNITFAATGGFEAPRYWELDSGGSAIRTTPDGLNLGTSGNPVGDIYAGNLYVSGITMQGQLIVDVDNTEALLVRKDGDAGDIFIVDTTNEDVQILSTTGGLTITPIAAYTTLLPNTSDYLRIGDAGTTSHTLNANDDLLITGELEVDGAAWFDGSNTTIDTLTAGLINMPQDGGLIDIMDIAVSVAAGDTTKQGYTFNIDANAALSLYAYDANNDGNANAPVLQIRAGKGEKAEAIAGSDSFNVGDYHFNVNTSGGAYTITLDSDFIAEGTATINSVAVITDWSGNAGANNITIATEGAELINGAATVTIGANYNTLHIKCNGTACVTF